MVWQFANVWEAPHKQINNAKRVVPAEPKQALTRTREMELASILLLPTKFDTPTYILLYYFLLRTREFGRQLKMNVRKAHRG